MESGSARSDKARACVRGQRELRGPGRVLPPRRAGAVRVRGGGTVGVPGSGGTPRLRSGDGSSVSPEGEAAARLGAVFPEHRAKRQRRESKGMQRGEREKREGGGQGGEAKAAWSAPRPLLPQTKGRRGRPRSSSRCPGRAGKSRTRGSGVPSASSAPAQVGPLGGCCKFPRGRGTKFRGGGPAVPGFGVPFPPSTPLCSREDAARLALPRRWGRSGGRGSPPPENSAPPLFLLLLPPPPLQSPGTERCFPGRRAAMERGGSAVPRCRAAPRAAAR